MLLPVFRCLRSRFDKTQLNKEIHDIKSKVAEAQGRAPPAYFESLKRNPVYQDLTHDEISRIKAGRARELQLDRKALWLKRQGLPDPEREAKKQLKQRKRLETVSPRPVLYTQPLQYTPYANKKIKHLEQQADRLTLESQLRAQVRKQKLASSALAHTPPPTLGDRHLDPIKRHIEMRKTRLQVLFAQYLDEYLVHNTSQIIHAHLQGATVAVVSVKSENFRKTQLVSVRVNSAHDPAWVVERLNVLAPKLRSQIAQRVNLGYMPEIKFELAHEVKQFNKARLAQLVSDVVGGAIDGTTQGATPGVTAENLRSAFEKEMNW